MNNNLYLYILVRTDLPSMASGRAAAQTSHASNAFIHRWGDSENDVKSWSRQTKQGFGTAIVLGVTFKQLQEKLADATEKGFKCEMILDPDYVISVSSEVIPYIDSKHLHLFKQSPLDKTKYFFGREEMTCGYIFGDKEKLSSILSSLPLYN